MSKSQKLYIPGAGSFNFKQLLGFTSVFQGAGSVRKPCEMLRNLGRCCDRLRQAAKIWAVFHKT